MTLAEIRVRIDAIDSQMKELFLARMNVAQDVAAVKNDAHETNIYRADREQSMIANLTADVAPELKAEYAAFIRKTTEVSRMYQYELLCRWNPEYLEEQLAGIEIHEGDTAVKVCLTREDRCNAMSAILSMVGDHGYNMKEMKLLGIDSTRGMATFELTILGSAAEYGMKKLLFQLSRECVDFRVLESC